MSGHSMLNIQALQANRNISARRYWKDRLKNFVVTSYFNNCGLSELLPMKSYGEYALQTSNGVSSLIDTKVSSDKGKHLILLSTLGVLAHKYSQQYEILIFTPLYNDLIKEEHTNQIVPVKISNLQNSTFKGLIGDLKTKILQDFKHANYPLKRILDLEFSQLEKLPKLGLCVNEVQTDTPLVDIATALSFSISTKGEELHIIIRYDKQKYAIAFIQQLGAHFLNLLQLLLDQNDVTFGKLDMLSPEERKLLLYDLNDTGFTVNKIATVLSLFDNQVKKNPKNIAFQIKDTTVSYGELDLLSNKVAHFLKNQERIVKGDRIGLHLGHEKFLLPMLLGVLKANAAFVPLDVNHPVERITAIAKSAELKLLISRGSTIVNGNLGKVKVLDLNQIEKDIENTDLHEKVHSLVLPEDLAYVIYTSGSTGRPKGVMIRHRALANYLSWGVKFYVNKEKATFALFTSIAFDLTLTSLLTPLISGDKIVIYDNEQENIDLETIVNNSEIDIIKLTPSHLKLVGNSMQITPDYSTKPKKFIVGGENLPYLLAKTIYDKFEGHIVIYNEYGPTEATVGCMIYTFNPNEMSTSVPIGNPIGNAKIYLLDQYLKPVPLNVEGELYISGVGLSEGYLLQPELTRERFIENPFLEQAKIYKTGDKAIRKMNQEVVFKGRVDEQIKIRGYRIELAEIEYHLNTHNLIKDAKVIPLKSSEDTFLVAYYISEKPLQNKELNAYLSLRLPAFMIPEFFHHLEIFPLTHNGKVDNDALPQPQRTATNDYEGPENDLEEQLVRLWGGILKTQSKLISVTSNFFEIGGHSLRATVLANLISKNLKVSVRLKDIFNYPTIRELAGYIKKCEQSGYIPIENAGNRAFYPLSSAQKRLYFLYEFERESIAYNMPNILRIDGNLDINKVKSAFEGLIDRHEILRTTFEVMDNTVVQKVHDQVSFEISFSKSEESKIEDHIVAFITPFDLSKGPLIRVGILQFKKTSFILMVDTHHILSDGVSQEILIKEFIKSYQGENVQKSHLQYRDYSVWQQKAFVKEKRRTDQLFWLKEFEEKSSFLELPTDYERPIKKDYQGDYFEFVLDEEITSQLRYMAVDQGVTMNILMFSVYIILLHKLSNQEDITVGTVVAGRQHADLQNMLGMFVNTLPIRMVLKREDTYSDFLGSLKLKLLQCFENQNYPYEDLVEDLKLDRNAGANPLFETMFVYQNFEHGNLEIPGLKIRDYKKGPSVARFDQTLIITEKERSINLSFGFATNLYRKHTIIRFSNYLKKIVLEIIRNKRQQIGEIVILSQKEKEQLLEEFSNATPIQLSGASIVDLFQKQAITTPDAIAVVYKNKKLTYDKLDALSNKLAHYLRSAGITTGSFVPLCMGRSITLIPTLLGILKAGGVYVPIDPNYPSERIDVILENLDAQMILTDGDFTSSVKIPSYDLEQLLQSQVKKESEVPLGIALSPNHLAYINYTSGSTGRPKGVMVKHSGVLRLLNLSDIVFNTATVTLQLSSITFDAATFEIWPTLLSGGKLVLYPESYVDLKKLNTVLLQEKITTLWLTSGLFDQWSDSNLEHLKLRYLLAGGDVVRPSSVEKVYTKLENVSIYNGYGPTENTTFTCCYKIPRERPANKSIPIGKPIHGTSVYIVDASLKICPIGVVGELLTGGIGLALGYLNLKDLTDKKFIRNTIDPGKYKKLYRTGDLAKWLPDGTIEYTGRVDSQLKIRGFRIEPSEIENHLSSHELIEEAVVIAKENETDKFLVCYYVSRKEIRSHSLKDYLLKTLPTYMIPSYFVHLEKIPLNINGKIDRQALPDPFIVLDDDYTAPTTELERKLVLIWAQILQQDPEVISISKSFFDLGGHSLLATVLVNKISQVFNVTVSLKDIFYYQSIHQIARYIDTKESSEYIEIPPAISREYYPQSSAQKLIYFMHEFDKDSLAYNMPNVLRLKGELDAKKLEEVFEQLITRHEILRTVFRMVDGIAVQYILPEVPFKMESFVATEDMAQSVINRFIRSFDLHNGPLIRAGLIQLNAWEYILMIDIHHIVSDGVSQNLLLNEFIRLYNGEQLDKLSLHYKDYAVWQQSESSQQLLEAQKSFWLEEFKDIPEVLSLPIDYPRTADRENYGGSFAFTINREDSTQIRKMASEEGITPFMFFLSFYYILLSKLTEQEDITIGTTVAGRQHSDLETMLGMFVNTLPLRNYVGENLTFNAFLSSMKVRVLKCLNNQEFSYEALIDELKIDRTKGRNPLFDVLFVYEQFQKSDLQLNNLEIRPFQSEHVASKLDLMFSVQEAKGEFLIYLEYSTKLFKDETIIRFEGYFKNIVSAILADPKIKIADIAILTESDKQLIVNEFNSATFDYPKAATILSLFEMQVEKNPKATAVIFEDCRMSYDELNFLSNVIAERIAEKLPESGHRIGLYFESSIEMIASIFGVMKAECVYVPLSPRTPETRNSYILEDSDSRLLLIQEKLFHQGSIKKLGGKNKIPKLKVNLKELSKGPRVANPQNELKPEDTINVIYTSGTTGKPKGVEVKNIGILNYICWRIEKFNYTSNDITLQLFPYIFDAYANNLYCTLLSGGTLLLVSEDNRLNPAYIANTMRLEKVTNSCTTPALYNVLLDEIKNNQGLESLRFIGVGGEKPSAKLIAKSKKIFPDLPVNNEYGPTESSVAVTFNNNIAPENGAIIGKPVPNTKIYILGKNMELLPPGMSGELCIGGIGLAKGYLNNEKLTREKFIFHPILQERIYKTGDIAKWNTDGNLEFIGRMDDQIKIRGFRIELGDIEKQLLTHDKVTEAKVQVSEKEEGDKYLVGYYVSVEDIDHKALKQFLSHKLPDYMIPSFYMRIAKMPLTRNGKIDRKALPEYKLITEDHYVNPTNETQRQLIAIWSDVLKVEENNIGIQTNFFDIGGNSIKLMNMVGKIKELLNSDLTVVNAFEYPTVELLAGFIANTSMPLKNSEDDVSVDEISATIALFDAEEES